MSAQDGDEVVPFRRQARQFARRVAEGMRLARLTPDEPLFTLFDAVGELPTELDRVHERWRDTAVADVRRALEEPTRHMVRATADLIQAGRQLSRGVAVVAVISLVVGSLLGAAIAGRHPAPDYGSVVGAVDQAIDTSIARHCQASTSQ